MCDTITPHSYKSVATPILIGVLIFAALIYWIVR